MVQKAGTPTLVCLADDNGIPYTSSSTPGTGPAETPSALKFARVNATADGDNTVIAAVATKKLRVIGYVIVASAAGTLSIKSGAATTLAAFPLAANGGVAYGGGYPAFETAAGEALVLNNSAGLDSTGHLSYIEV